MPRGWEGNRRSGVALAMRHGLKWSIHLRAQRPRVGDEHPTLRPSWGMAPFTFYLYRPNLIFRKFSVSVAKAAFLMPNMLGVDHR